ncbi:MAG: enoyl-CoA hydratase/isomerase family protein [Cyclobacteriaceae bacterium]|jgi:methylglutaconyl-CoA hydratase|nr:enoyl-CoA hydratase-related protein [Flammeovirgaceae bacterium]
MSLVLYSKKERIGYITLNRPEKRNALSHELVAELKSTFAQAEADEEVKVVVLKANGEAFCAGADLAYVQQLQHFSFEENKADSHHLKELFLQIYQLKKVVIAQVQGHALAGGCGLATVCDFAFAVPEVKFGYTEVRIGFIPAMVLVFLIRKIGEQKARQLLLTGELINGTAAKEMGLVSTVVSKEELEKTVYDFAQKLITSNSGRSMQITKQMIGEVQSMSLTEALNYAATMNAHARATEDCKSGIAAFLEKREWKW